MSGDGLLRNKSDSAASTSLPPPPSLQHTPGRSSSSKRVLGVLSVASVAYFNVCGGPWGAEDSMSAVGPLPGFIGIFLFAFMWAIPIILVTAELSSAFPDDGGYSLWVGQAFGRFGAFQETYFSWVSGVIDNAIYPGIVYSSGLNVADHIVGQDLATQFMHTHSGWKYVTKLGLATLFMLPNVFCIKKIGTTLQILGVIVILPFVALVCFCFNKIEPERLFLAPPPTSDNKEGGYSTDFGDWLSLFSVLYWNMSGFDCISTFAGEVSSPGSTFINSLLLCLFMVMLTYLLPLMFCVMATDPVELTHWGTDDGEYSWTKIAENLGGVGLMYCVLVASILGNMGMYIAELFEDSWQLCGMAESGIAPAIFGRKSARFGTPVNAVLASWIFIVPLCYFDFLDNLAINNFFSCAGSILEVLSFVKLRFSQPSLHRPYKVPGNRCVAVLLAIPPLLIGCVVCVSGFVGSRVALQMNLSGLAVGVGLYFAMGKLGMKYEYDPATKRLLSAQLRPNSANYNSLGNGRRNSSFDNFNLDTNL